MDLTPQPPRTSGRRRIRRKLGVFLMSALLTAGVAVTTATPAQATVGNPVVRTTPAGTTSAAATQGKAGGSGLWGYVGDIKTRNAGAVYSYGLAVSPLDGSVWVTDSAKAIYTSSSLICGFAGGTLFGGVCYVGESRVMHYSAVGTDWAVGQYAGNGTYAAPPAGANGGIGANYESLADATVLSGTEPGMTNGEFGGVRGLAIADDGTAWIADSDTFIGSAIASNAGKNIRLIAADESEGASFGGSATWAQRYEPGRLLYPVGVAKLTTGNVLISSTTADLLQEFQPDGTWVRNILLDRPANTAYAGDAGFRNPNGLAVDPTTGDILVNYTAAGSGRGQMVERIDASTGALVQTIGVGALPNNTNGFALAVDPKTGELFVAMENGQLYTFAADGTYLGRFSAFGSGSANGQLSQTVRGIAFDARGFLYVTVAEGTASTRVQILARTPDPVTAVRASYACAVDGDRVPTGAIDRTSVEVNWAGVTEGVTADAQTPVRDYVIERSADDGTTWAVVPTATATTWNETVAGLNPNVAYQFRVSAWNEAGNGDTSVTTVSDPVCDRPETEPGTVVVSKTVVDGGTAPTADTNYAFTLTCTVDGQPVVLPTADQTFTLTSGAHRSISAPAGASCTAAELSVGAFTTSYLDSDIDSPGAESDGTVLVRSQTESTIVVTNAYPAPEPGSLTVTKTVTGDPAPPATAFTFGLSCRVADSAVALAESDQTFDLLAGGSRNITGIPAGATCSVSEAERANFTATFNDSDGDQDGQVTIGSETAATVTVTNRYTAPPAQCVADRDAVSVVYSTRNDSDAPLDGSYTVHDRVGVGRSDMKLVYTVEKPCVSYPVPVLTYDGDWPLDGSDADTYAVFQFSFGATSPEVAADYRLQLAAMNALLEDSPTCADRSVANFDACLRPIIETWGESVPVGITGTVTTSVRSATPGEGTLSFHLEQMNTGEPLSREGITPYSVTQPTLTLTGGGKLCSATLPGYTTGSTVYTPTHAEPEPVTFDARAADTGTASDDVTPIPVDDTGITYVVGSQSFATGASVRDFLAQQRAGAYLVGAQYIAPDGVSALDPDAVTVDVLGASSAACFSATDGPVLPPTAEDAGPLAKTGVEAAQLLSVAFGACLLLLGGIGLMLRNRRRRTR